MFYLSEYLIPPISFPPKQNFDQRPSMPFFVGRFLILSVKQQLILNIFFLSVFFFHSFYQQGNLRKGFWRCRLSCLLYYIHTLSIYPSAHNQLKPKPFSWIPQFLFFTLLFEYCKWIVIVLVLTFPYFAIYSNRIKFSFTVSRIQFFVK